MSKERARRRAAREHEAALRRAARAAEQERRERQAARRRRLRSATTGLVRPPLARPVGRATGPLASRRRRQTAVLVAAVLCLNVLLWAVRPDWEARLAGIVLSLLAFPVLRLLVLPGR